MEPLPEDEPEKFVFAREIVGNAIPPSFIPACEKGFREACNSGGLTGHPVQVSRSVHLRTPEQAYLNFMGSQLVVFSCDRGGLGNERFNISGSLTSHPMHVSQAEPDEYLIA